ncbi:MAG: hypothetical protein NXI00_24270, partial [Cytophagales bacterium]|nr:hypothetical protein [Cytophagales bacterium]
MNPYWLNCDPVCRFIGRIISFALETNSSFRRTFLKQIGVEALLSLAYSSSTESVRYAVKSFFVISIHTDNVTYLLKHALFMEAIIHLLNVDDVMVKRYCLHTFFNLTTSELFNDTLTQRKLNLFVQQLKTSDRRLLLDVLIILSQVRSPLSTKAFIEANVYENVYGCLSSESTIQWWEIQYTHVEVNIEEILTEHLANSETRLLSDLNTVTLRYLNSVFSMASRRESEGISEHICQYNEGTVLRKICLFAGSIEIRIQREACKLICYLSQHPQCRDAIVQQAGAEWMLGSFKFVDVLRQKYLFNTLAQLSFSFNSSYQMIDDSLVDYFLQLTESQDLILQEHSVTILAHMT